MPKGGAASYWIDIYKSQLSQLGSSDMVLMTQSTRTQSEQTPTHTNAEPIPVHITTHQQQKRRRTITSTFDIKLTQPKLACIQMYGNSEMFPDDVIFFKDVFTAKLLPAPHHQIATHDMNNVVESRKCFVI